MRVIVNNLTAIRQKTGIGHHVSELLRCLRAQEPADRFIAYPGRCATAAIHAWANLGKALGRLRPSRPAKSAAGTGRPGLHTVARGLTAWHFRTFWAGRAFDLYHEPNYIPLPCDLPTVATVHDLSVLLHPEWHPADRVAYYERHFAAGLMRCAHLIAVSECTRSELIAEFAVPAERVTCIYNGIRPGLTPMDAAAIRPTLARLGLPGQYLLHVGTLEPRKNLLLLLRAFGDLPAPVREHCPLVLAGGWGWNARELAEQYHTVARHQGVMHLGYVADADLPALYNGARALVFPSHYEGFGLPPVEMLACGGAVLASTVGAVVETAGRQAHLIEPTDLAGWRDAMHRIITDDDWHAALRRGGPDWALHFTWQHCARQTYQIYQGILGQPARHAEAA
jgi:alpha-1,3-rhamnosyl/mannosyltransferase